MTEPRLVIHRHAVVHWGHDERITEHASPAWKVLIGVDADVDVASAQGHARARCILVAPHVRHSVRSPGWTATFLSEPGTRGVPLRANGPRIRPIDGRLGERLSSAAHAQTESLSHDALAHAEVFRELGLMGPTRFDRRVGHVLSAVAAAPDVDLGPLLARHRISASRLRHIVAEQTGLALRTHRLWRRTMMAVEAIVSGAGIGAAAATAGFADHAHFTRAFVRFVGRVPSSMHGRTAVLDSYSERPKTHAPSSRGEGPVTVRPPAGAHACGLARASS
jgi:AraC-like DNA-binding protein